MGLAQINIRFKANLSELSTQMQTAAREIKKQGEQMQAYGKSLSTYVTLPLVAAGTAAFSMAADFEDALGATDQIFKKSAGSVQKWAEGLPTYFGIAKKEALEYSNMMGSMLKNIGNLTEQEAAKQSSKLIELAGDLTAMYGGTTADAVRALTGALKGNNTMLDNYGMASVGLVLPSIFSVTNSPITSTGNLTAALVSQAANTVFAAPSGTAGTPSFRTLVAADIPTLNQNTTGTSGSLAVARIIAMTGDVNYSVSFNGSANVTAVGTIATSAVTHQKYQNIATARILGRVTATSGNVEELTNAQVLSFLGVQAGANNYTHPNHSGDVTSLGDGATTIVNNAVTFPKMRNIPSKTLLGRGTVGTGDVELINMGDNLSISALGVLDAVDTIPTAEYITIAGNGQSVAVTKSETIVAILGFSNTNISAGANDGDLLIITSTTAGGSKNINISFIDKDTSLKSSISSIDGQTYKFIWVANVGRWVNVTE